MPWKITPNLSKTCGFTIKTKKIPQNKSHFLILFDSFPSFVPDLGDQFWYNRLYFWAGRRPIKNIFLFNFFYRDFIFSKYFFGGLSIHVLPSEVVKNNFHGPRRPGHKGAHGDLGGPWGLKRPRGFTLDMFWLFFLGRVGDQIWELWVPAETCLFMQKLCCSCKNC